MNVMIHDLDADMFSFTELYDVLPRINEYISINNNLFKVITIIRHVIGDSHKGTAKEPRYPVIAISKSKSISAMNNLKKALNGGCDYYSGSDIRREDGFSWLKFPESPKKSNKKERTPQKYFEEQILSVLSKSPNKELKCSDVANSIYNRIRSKLKTGDFETVSRGEPRWKNSVRWAKDELKTKGLIGPPIKKGVWTLTTKGVLEANKIKESKL